MVITIMLSKGRTPSKTTVTRVLSGISAGFALTFVRYGWLLFLAGVLLLVSGIVFGCVLKNDAKRASAAMMLFLLAGNVIFPLFVTEICANDASAEMVEPVSAFNFQNGGSLYSNDIAEAFYRSGVDQLRLAPGFIEYEMNGCCTPEGSQKKLRLDASDEAFTVVSGKDNPYRYDPKISFDALGLVEWDHKIPAGISVDMDFGENFESSKTITAEEVGARLGKNVLTEDGKLPFTECFGTTLPAGYVYGLEFLFRAKTVLETKPIWSAGLQKVLNIRIGIYITNPAYLKALRPLLCRMLPENVASSLPAMDCTDFQKWRNRTVAGGVSITGARKETAEAAFGDAAELASAYALHYRLPLKIHKIRGKIKRDTHSIGFFPTSRIFRGYL